MLNTKSWQRHTFGCLTLRPLFFCCIALIGGIWASSELLQQRAWAVSVISGLLIGLTLVSFVIKNKKATVVSLACLSAFIVGIAAFYIQYACVEAQRIGYNNVKLTGYACELTEVSDERLHGYLRDCTITFSEGKEKNLRGYVSINAYGSYSDLRISSGDRLEMQCAVVDVFVYRDGIDVYAFKQDNFYRVDEVLGSITVTQGEPSLRESIREYIQSRYSLYLSEENSGVAMAVVLGDKSMLDGELSESYRKTGLAHLFSVSGLHVGFVATCISFILKKLKLKRYATFICVTAGMLFYGWVCGFPSSVVRAIIMSSLGILTLYRESDMLSNVSFAAIFMALMNPTVIFDGAFQLSFGAVFGIATIGTYINAAYERKRKSGRLKDLVGSVSACVGATLGTLPFVLVYYGEISLISPLCNMLTIAAMSVVFVMLLVCLIPFLSGFLIIPNIMITVINSILVAASELSFATVNAASFGSAAFFFFIFLLLICGELGFRGRLKHLSAGCLIVVIVLGSVISTQPLKTEDRIVYAESGYTLFVSNEGEFAVVTQLKSTYTAFQLIEELSVYGKIDYDLIIIDPERTSPEALSVLIKEEKASLSSVVFPQEDADESDAYYVAAARKGLIGEIKQYKGFGVYPEYFITAQSSEYLGLRVFFEGKEYLFPSADGTYQDEFLLRIIAPIGFISCSASRVKDFSSMNIGPVVTAEYAYADNIYSCRREGKLDFKPD